MAKNSVPEWDTTATNNTDVGGVSTAEGQQPGLLNDGMREMMAQIKKAVASQGSDIASASTTDIGAATGQYVKVTGTTTITALGTVAAGTMRWVEFTGALTLTHNGTSLKLPTSANITTAAGDTACFVSLGSGNWKCLEYMRLDGTALSYGSSLSITSSSAGELLTLTSTEAGATSGPDLVLHRDSASPADNDLIGTIIFRGEDDGSAATDYASIQAQITDVTNGTEDCSLYFTTLAAGAATQLAIENGGMRALGFGLANKGQGTINMAGLYAKDAPAAGPVYIIQDQKSSGTNGGGITSGAWRTHTLNTEVLDEIGITTTTNVMALAAGTYKASFWSTFYATDVSQCRLQDTTNTVTLGIGNNIRAGAAIAGISAGHAYFVLSGAANVELQVRVSTTNGTDGGGQATSWGTEVYASVYLEKVA
jgi:hypothetical protein